VKYHDRKSGALYLAHEYPRLPYQIVARLDLDHVLETLSNVDFEIGVWLNVVGYICGRTVNPQYTIDVGSTPVYSEISIRSVMIWNAASIDLGLYEKTLVARKESGTTGL
jgi:hypothetical protein